MNKGKCGCTEIIGHLEEVQELLVPRKYKPSSGCLLLGDWTKNYYIWPKYIQSCDDITKGDLILNTAESKYWSIDDVQRYFFGELHCEQVLFTYQYPNLRLPTKLGRYSWKTNTALKLPSKLYQKELHLSIEFTLKKMELESRQMNRLIISDQLIHLDRLDHFKRKTFMKMLLKIMSVQDNLQLVSLENLCSTRLEGVRLIQQLACFNANSLKYLFLWRFVQPNENPLLINYSYITGSGKYLRRPDLKHCFTRSLGTMKNLKLLAIEYSHLADGTGAAILSLLPVINKPHFRLQLICREDQIPGRIDASLGVGGYIIPDAAWRRIAICCPDLYLQIVFVRVRDYDNVIRFLTPSMPLRELHLQLGIDLKQTQRQDSDLSCIMRLMAYRYSNSLGTLNIHQWRFATFPLRKVFEIMPGLTCFYYTGMVESESDIRAMLNTVACGVCNKLQKLHVLIQTEILKDKCLKKFVATITEEYSDIMELFNIDFKIQIYKI